MTPYFIHEYYFATGEGMTHILNLVIAETEEEACERFVKKHFVYEGANEERIKEIVADVGPRLEVLNVTTVEGRARMKELLEVYLKTTHVDYLMRAEEAGALHEFEYKSYVNYS